jgi:hypothetical protein
MEQQMAHVLGMQSGPLLVLQSVQLWVHLSAQPSALLFAHRLVALLWVLQSECECPLEPSSELQSVCWLALQ